MSLAPEQKSPHWKLREDLADLRDDRSGFLPTQLLSRALETPHNLVHFRDETEDARGEARRLALEGQGASIELRLGDEYYVSTLDTPRYLSDTNTTLVIPGGQFALLTTFEDVDVPIDCLALISMKSKAKLRGLVNISGFHIDPGFRGTIHYAVFNAGPSDIIVARRERLFQLFLATLVEHTEKPYDKPVKRGLSLDLVSQTRGRSVSLDELASAVDRLKTELQLAAGLGVASVVALVAILLTRGG